jgi:hypothetical protein
LPGETVHRPLCPELLDERDDQVEGNGSARQEGVADLAQDEQGQEERDQGDIERGEDVLAQDVDRRTTSRRSKGIRRAAGRPLGNLGRSQAR